MKGRQYYLWIVVILIGFTACSERISRAECGPTTVEIQFESDGCLEPGTTVTGTIKLMAASVSILGGQFFIEYDPAVLAVESVSAGDPPFTFPLFINVATRGKIDYSVVVFPFDHPGTLQETIMGRIEFSVLSGDVSPYFRFRLNDPPSPTQLLIANSGLVPILADDAADANDLRQFAKMQRCFNGEDVLATAECECMLAGDSDGDIDLLDFWVFSLSWVGPSESDCG